MATTLHCCLGGDPGVFHVHRAYDFGFWFSVASKPVGFVVYARRTIV